MKNTPLTLITVIVVSLMTGCNPQPEKKGTRTRSIAERRSFEKSDNADIEKKIEDLIGQMTLEEKIGQMTQINNYEVASITRPVRDLKFYEKDLFQPGESKDLHSLSNLPTNCGFPIRREPIFWKTAILR